MLQHPQPCLRSLLAAVALAAAATAQAPFTPGNLVVTRIGDGVASLTSAAQAVFLDEYDSAGNLVQSIALPTAAAGANLPLTNSGTATSEANLQLSADGNWLVQCGYAAAPGTTGVAATSSATVARVIACTDVRTGLVDSSTSTNNAFSGNNIRSATTDNGTQFWAVGANSGVQYLPLGGTTSTALTVLSPTNMRVCSIQGGQLYVSSASSTFQGVSAVGTGIPVPPPTVPIALLNGFPTASGPSSYDFFFADADTLYVADDRASVLGGIQKWTQSGGTWTLQYTLNPGTNIGCRCLTGTVGAGVATLYATTTETTGNHIVAVIDTGATATFATVATAGANTILRGIRQLPPHGSIVRQPIGCGPTTIAVTGQPALGGAITTTLGNTVGLPILGLGFALVQTPFCGCTVGHDWGASVFGTTSTLHVPGSPSFLGTVVGIQGVDLFGNGGCPAPQLTLTDTMVVTIG